MRAGLLAQRAERENISADPSRVSVRDKEKQS
jgi:hypothetical protein